MLAPAATWHDAARDMIRKRRRKKLLHRHFSIAENATMQRGPPPEMTRGQLYAYHLQNGTLGLYYVLFPEAAPAV